MKNSSTIELLQVIVLSFVFYLFNFTMWHDLVFSHLNFDINCVKDASSVRTINVMFIKNAVRKHCSTQLNYDDPMTQTNKIT